MKKKDCIIKGLLFNNKISITLLDCTQLVNVCIQKHNLSKLAAETMGRVLLVTGYISASLKNVEDSCSITIKGDGLGGDIFASGNFNLHLRGYIANTNISDVMQNGQGITACVGTKGTVTVIYQENGKPFTGTTNLVAGDITEDFIAYFTQSEQRYTDLHLQVILDEQGNCKTAHGIVMQALPQAELEDINNAILLMQKFYTLNSVFERENAIAIWQENMQVQPLTIKQPTYTCTCSRQKMQALLLTLGVDELNCILQEEGKVDIHCHYCNTDYIFLKDDIDKLFAK